jgi:hypothetical protein
VFPAPTAGLSLGYLTETDLDDLVRPGNMVPLGVSSYWQRRSPSSGCQLFMIETWTASGSSSVSQYNRPSRAGSPHRSNCVGWFPLPSRYVTTAALSPVVPINPFAQY